MGKKYAFIIMSSLGVALVIPASGRAQQDVRGVRLENEATRVIEEKCLRCHNRKLIDESVKNRQEMDKVLRNMEKKGVVLSGRERQVMGLYWGQKVFKGGKREDLNRRK